MTVTNRENSNVCEYHIWDAEEDGIWYVEQHCLNCDAVRYSV
ncbi:MAG TPA: hypothetical protein VLE21_04700 [Candidatus Nitrosocosmicus sp.]|nr:hypothetical protein [Candidatus Nitrosocosmicus sp.]